MKRLTKLMVLVVSLGLGSMAFANGLSLNSIGVKSMAMGGAYVGYANDATALYWNPAGLAGQGTSLVVWGSDIIPLGTYKNDAYGIDAEMVKNHYPTGNIIFNWALSDKMALSFGAYVPAGLGAEWDDPMLAAGKSLMTKLGVLTFSPGFAYKISDKFSVGVAVNISYAMFDMDQPVNGGAAGYFQYSESSTGLGYGATLGLKFDVSEAFSVGATFRSASNVTMSGDATNGLFGALGMSEKSDFSRDVTWPMWIAGGIAYKGFENLVITADVQYSNWSELQELVTEYDDAMWKAALEPTDDHKMVMKWDDAIQYRVGMEYTMSKAFALRLGYYYDPAPAPDETVNILFPSSTNNAFTGGFTYAGGPWSIDFGLEYLLGADRDITTATDHNMPGTHHLDVFAFAFGFNWAF